MAWVAFDCGILNHPKMTALPSDTARLGFIAVVLEAKQQRQPGRFADTRHFRAVMGRYARFLPLYIERRLIDQESDGSLLVHDWADYQRDKADTTAAERMRRHRERQRDGERDAPVTRNSHASPAGGRAVAVSVPVVVQEENDDLGTDSGALVRVVERLANRTFGFSPGSRVWQTMLDDERALGKAKVEAAYRAVVAEADGPVDIAGIIYAGHKRLFPIPDAPRVSPAQRKQSEHDELLAKARRGELRTRPVPS
jgi:hypothetical protein